MRIIRFFIALYLLLSQINAYAQQQFLFPLDCTLGDNCWISSLPRHYLRERQLDFRCGPNTSNGNTGTSIALRDLKQMHAGVKVIAPFDGFIEAKRNNVSDNDIHEDIDENSNLECGNGLIIANEFTQAQLCHLKKGSIRHSIGEKVKAGDVLGEVGLSGMTQYPHLHITFNEKSGDRLLELDPFYGKQPDCGLSPKSMWKDAELLDANARSGIIYNYGFAFDTHSAKAIRSGTHSDAQPENPQEFIGFVDMLSANKGDKIEISILNDKNEVIITRWHKFSKHQSRYFFYISKKLRGYKLSGDHNLFIKYTHSTGEIENIKKTIRL